MSDHLDRDTVERMLRGEDTGPPNVAELLAAMSARPVRNDRRGEEIAITAFREARPTLDVPAPASRRLLMPRVLTVKAALAGILLMLAGGVAVAASPHLPAPLGNKRTPATRTRTPAASESAAKRLTAAPVPSHAPSSPRPAHDRDHPHEKAQRPGKNPSPYESRKSGPSSKGRSTGKWGQPVPDLPLPVSRPPVCDALCGLDG